MGITFERQQMMRKLEAMRAEAAMLEREIDSYDEWAPAPGRRRIKQLNERLDRLERQLRDQE